MLPAGQEPGQEPALQGPLAPFPADSRGGDPSIPDHRKSSLSRRLQTHQDSISLTGPLPLPWAVWLPASPAGAVRLWGTLWELPHAGLQQQAVRDGLCQMLSGHPWARQGFPISWSYGNASAPGPSRPRQGL